MAIGVDIAEGESTLDLLLIAGVVLAAVYIFYEVYGNSSGGALCGSLGVGCGSTNPTTGLGGVATSVGSAVGTLMSDAGDIADYVSGATPGSGSLSGDVSSGVYSAAGNSTSSSSSLENEDNGLIFGGGS